MLIFLVYITDILIKNSTVLFFPMKFTPRCIPVFRYLICLPIIENFRGTKQNGVYSRRRSASQAKGRTGP